MAGLLALLPACDDASPTGPVDPKLTVTMTGTVVDVRTGAPVDAAIVRIGAVVDTTEADGHFELADLPPGEATLHASAPWFDDFSAVITVDADASTRSIRLRRMEVLDYGEFTLHVPFNVLQPRGVFVALGGPDTRAFASGAPFGAPSPEVESSLQALGTELRRLAAGWGLAVLGTSSAGLANGPASDQRILDAIREGAEYSGRPGLETVPVLLYGMGSGGPEASGLAARHPERVAGAFLKVPLGVASLDGGEALGVPALVVLAELDAFVDNSALTAAFRANRSAGAPWALVQEAGVPHHSLTREQRELTVSWMRTIVETRIGRGAMVGLHPVDLAAGWLGDPDVGFAHWSFYPGDPESASWLPTRATVGEWAGLAGAGPAIQVVIDPDLARVAAGDSIWLSAAVRDSKGNSIANPSFDIAWECFCEPGSLRMVEGTAGRQVVVVATGQAGGEMWIDAGPPGPEGPPEPGFSATALIFVE